MSVGVHSVLKNVVLGEGSVVWNHCNLYGCSIGRDCRVASFVEIGRGVIVGDGCKIEAGAFIPEGVVLEDGVFVGPHVCFTNDLYPEAGNASWKVTKTLIKRGASIGANSTILCGVTIGEGALIGCGSLVLKDVPDGMVFRGGEVFDRKRV